VYSPGFLILTNYYNRYVPANEGFRGPKCPGAWKHVTDVRFRACV
jgi:hypothetical protein